MSLGELVKISNFYGRNEDFVLAGGGNTSYKDKDFLYIKGSGTSLATITEDGFVKMNRKRLSEIWDKTYPETSDERESLVLADLMAARENDDKRPSVETLLHDLFPQSYVVHTHPALINGLTCSVRGETAAEELFGGDAIWIPPTMPGYVLARAVREKIEEQKSKGKRMDIVFLANHGVFAAGNSPDEIKSLMCMIFDKIISKISRKPDFSPVPKDFSDVLSNLKNIIDAQSVLFECNREIQSYVESRERFNKVYSAFTPDHMVYYKHKAMFVGKNENLKEALESFTSSYGFKPKIVAFEGLGVFACDESEKAALTDLMLFKDTVKIAVYSESFGGGVFMPDWLIDFIANWEAESYRKSQSK
ncbi:MAG: short chain dehydrogenase [Firmicutes bacterium ADurb.Bin193]|nr:MAG: short chain dehydrogenase [Firmicutes bacterium ADurb.Bin193]